MPSIRALLVDDEALARRGMRQLLAAHPDVDVVGECRDGRAALAALTDLRPDLVFLDVQMPELDGFAFCKKVREWPQYSRTPIIFVTGQDDFETRIHSVLSGGNDLIAKPFLFMELAVKALTCVLRGQLGIARP